jgi:TRAP-type mannitol/chloroaromatic compound transport system substrate-binding protein
MDRREFLKSTATAAAATAAGATGAAAAAPSAPAISKGLQQLRIAISCEDGFAGPADWANRLARSIHELSGARFEMVPAFGTTDASAAIGAGNADLCFDYANALLDVNRGAAYFAGLPGTHGVTPHQLATWISVGGGQALWDDLAADADVKPLLAAHTGAATLMLATRRADEIAALAGLKMYIDGLGRDVARGLGMDVVSTAPGQLPTAMREGEVDAAECGGAIASYALGLLNAAPYSAGTSIYRNGTAMYLGVSRKFWDTLSSSDQALIARAATAEYQLSLAEEEAHRQFLSPAPASERVWPIAAELQHAIERVSAAVVAHAAGSDATSRRIADSFAAFKRATHSTTDVTA